MIKEGKEPNYDISILRINAIDFWLRCGYHIPADRHVRVSKSEREYLIKHYNLVLSPNLRRYVCNVEELFEQMKSEHEDKFNEFHITDFNKLVYVAIK